MSQFTDNVKLENAKAQLQVVLSDTRTAQESLNRLVSEQEKVEASLAETISTLHEKKGEVAFCLKQREFVYQDIADQTRRLKKIESELQAKFKQSDKASLEQADRLRSEKAVLDRMIQKSNQELIDLSLKIDSAESDLSKLKELTSSLPKLQESVISVKQELDTLSNRLSEAQNAASKEFKKLSDGLIAARAVLAQEQAKVISYEEHVAKDKKNLSRRENDLLIKEKRYQEMFKKLYRERH